MPRPGPILLVASVLLVLPLVGAHPPSADNHRSCAFPVDPFFVQGTPGAAVPVTGTLGYFALPDPLPPSRPRPPPPPPAPKCPSATTLEWASHAATCPPPPFVGAVNGAVIGPQVPFFGTATCTWAPMVETVPTHLVIGFDENGDGRVHFGSSGLDLTLFVGPTLGYPQGAWNVFNPSFFGSARVIAFPTSTTLSPGDVLAPGDVSLVGCAVP